MEDVRSEVGAANVPDDAVLKSGCERVSSPDVSDCAPESIGPGAAAARSSSSQLVLYRSSQPALPSPRWPAALHTSALPYCCPGWTEGLLQVRSALYSNCAIRLAAVLERPLQLSEALICQAHVTHGSPEVTAAWRSRTDVHRFLCYSEEKQALEGPYKLRCPDTSPLVLPAAMGGGSGAAPGGGEVRSPRRPSLAEALRCLEGWEQHKVLIQLDICRLVIHHQRASGPEGGRCRGGGGPRISPPGGPCPAAQWSVDWEPCGWGCGCRPRSGDDGTWHFSCMELLSPVLKWVRQDLLGSFWGLQAAAPVDGGGCPPELNGPEVVPPGDLQLQLPYSGGKLSLEWGSDGALLPLRYDPAEDRVLVQIRGRRRVLLVPPEHGLPYLAPFPVLHPYDGYSMPAVAHTLVYDTPDVDVGRAARAVLAAWGQLNKVTGYVAVLEPGDALLLPAGWFLHSELLPQHRPTPPHGLHAPAPPPPVAATGLGPSGQGAAPRTAHNIALVLSLEPRRAASNAGERPQQPAAPRPLGPDRTGTTTAAHSSNTARAAVTDGNIRAANERYDGGEGAAEQIPSLPAPSQQLQHAVTPGTAGVWPVTAAPGLRPVAPGRALLQLSRLLEIWAVAAEVPAGMELRRFLWGMAEYHRTRRSLERRQQQARQRVQREQKQVQAGPDGPAQPEFTGGRVEASSVVDKALQWQQRDEDQAAAQPGSGRPNATLPSLASQLMQLQLHPTFNVFSPRGRVLMELYDTVVQHVAPVASSVLAAIAAMSPPPPPPPAAAAPGQPRGCAGRGQQRSSGTSRPTGRGDCSGGDGGGRSGGDFGGGRSGGDGGGRSSGDFGGCSGGDGGGRSGAGRRAAEGGAQVEDSVGEVDGCGPPDDEPSLGGVATAAVPVVAAAPADGDVDGLEALLRLVCEDRLHSTDWINQLCRDPEVAREQLLWYDDRRTADEARFPELFRLQVTAKDVEARLTSLKSAALPYQNLLVRQPLAAPQRPERLPPAGGP